ncbi:hypothetical protein ACUNWD_19595 [Sunxiuqinia sp. A32]|uniref:hypothetical protein n=1 Tax=Sunxiuqinia sp. A32 TaxID=3461496 RepID=UPI004045736C
MKTKRIFIALILIIAVLLAAVIILPVLFKDELVQRVKSEINNNVNANVDFADLNISLFRSFPNVQIELEALSITGKEQFQGDTLLAIGSVATDISLSDLFKMKSNGMQISSLYVTAAQINLLSTADGFSNWDITLPVEATKDQPQEESSFSVSLNDIQITGLNLNYEDEISTAVVRLKDSKMSATGLLKGTVTTFDFDAEVGEFVVEYDSVQYIANTTLKAKSQLEADYEKMSFILGESTLYLNELPLDLGGKIEMPSDSIYFDIQFKQPGSDFESLLAMIPKDYQSYLEGVNTSGDAGFEGSVKGWYYEDNYPQINSHLFIKNASLQYADLPEKIQQINLETTIDKPQGDLNLLTVLIENAHAQIRDNPVSMNLSLKNLIEDAAFDGNFNGKINFNNLSNAIPMDSIELKGVMEGKLALKGKMSAVEKNDFAQIASSGNFNFSNFSVLTPQISQPVAVQSGAVVINSRTIQLKSFKGNIGQSDFVVNGDITNYLQYLFNDQELKGNFKLNSNLMNLNELANLMVDEAQTEAAAEDEMLAFSVPGNLDLTFASTISRALFDRMDIQNIDGVIIVKNEKLSLKQLDMDMLRGKLTIDGSYQNNPENKPLFDFSMNIKSFDIHAAYQSLSMMQRYMPIAAKSQGNISSQIKFNGRLNEKLEIIASTMDGNGFFNTQDLQILDSPTFDQIKNFIKKEKLKNVRVEDFTANFNIEDGNLLLKPFQTKIADQQATIYGNLNVENLLNLNMDFKVNKDDLGADITSALGFLPGTENIKLLDVSVKLTGPVKEPEVNLDLSKARKQIQEEIKKSSTEEIQKSVKKIGDQLKKIFN